MTKSSLEAALSKAQKQLATLRECHQTSEAELSEATKMLQAFMQANDCGTRYLPASHDGLQVSDMLIAIAKGWFRNHPVSSADQVSRGARALLQAAREEAWLYRAQAHEPEPESDEGDDASKGDEPLARVKLTTPRD